MEAVVLDTNINSLLQQYLLLGSGSDNGPLSLLECMTDGSLDIAKYLQYSERESKLDEIRLKLTVEMIKKAGARKKLKVKMIDRRPQKRR
jgi:hypothetical protein